MPVVGCESMEKEDLVRMDLMEDVVPNRWEYRFKPEVADGVMQILRGGR